MLFYKHEHVFSTHYITFLNMKYKTVIFYEVKVEKVVEPL